MPAPADPLPSVADLRAKLARAQAAASAPAAVVTMLLDPPPGTPVGFTAWACGPIFGPRHVVVMPSIVPDAPAAFLDRVVARVLAIGAGRCPLCGAVAALQGPEPILAFENADAPLRNRANWTVLDLAVGIRHQGECPAVFGEADRRWFDPRAFELHTQAP